MPPTVSLPSYWFNCRIQVGHGCRLGPPKYLYKVVPVNKTILPVDKIVDNSVVKLEWLFANYDVRVARDAMRIVSRFILGLADGAESRKNLFHQLLVLRAIIGRLYVYRTCKLRV